MGKQPTGKEEDLFISISCSAAPLELSLGSGYRNSLLLSSIFARISPSETKHRQTGTHTNQVRACFCSVMTGYSGDITCPYGIIKKMYLEAPTESAQKMLCQLRGRKVQIDGELMISITANSL